MRHAKHSHQLGRKKEHRSALMANLAMALIQNRKIRTTLAKAKALRPFVEKIITLAKKAHATDNKVKKHHYHRLAFSRVRDVRSVNRLFNDLVEEFVNRSGGYTRIYKLVPRRGDAADMALIELISAGDEGYGKRKSKAKKSTMTKEAAAKEPKAEELEEVAPAEEPQEETTVAEGAADEEPVRQEEAAVENLPVDEEPTEEPIAESAEAEEAEELSVEVESEVEADASEEDSAEEGEPTAEDVPESEKDAVAETEVDSEDNRDAEK